LASAVDLLATSLLGTLVVANRLG